MRRSTAMAKPSILPVGSSTTTAETRSSVEAETLSVEAETLFESFVPIGVESDIFPADWTVVVEDLTGSTVKSFSGFTSDGIIQTNWDGTDSNNNPVAGDAAYKITVIVNASSSSLQSGSSFQATSQPALMKSGVNRYGMMDYEIEEKVPDLSAGYDEAFAWYFKLTDKEKEEYPPIPPAPPNEVLPKNPTSG
jgi:flagellar hook assembly protein FlgD